MLGVCHQNLSSVDSIAYLLTNAIMITSIYAGYLYFDTCNALKFVLFIKRIVSDIAIFVLKRDVKLQLTNFIKRMH